MKQCCATYIAARPPRSNCSQCWTRFFSFNVGTTRAIAMALVKIGRDKVIASMGEKFVKKLELFIKKGNG